MATPDRERLREAVERRGKNGIDMAGEALILAAARAVLEAPEVEIGQDFVGDVYLRAADTNPQLHNFKSGRYFLVPSQPEETL